MSSLKNIFRPVFFASITLLYYFFRVFSIKCNKVVITNYYGKGFGDNGKAIAIELYNQEPNIDIVWLVNNYDCNMPAWIRQVKYGSIKSIYENVTAKFWIDNARKRSFVRKRKKQYYIQTWHGCLALKRVEKDVEQVLYKEYGAYVKMAKNDSKMANLFLSNSTYCTEMYRRAFWYDGEILECGTPRCDQLFTKNLKSKPIHDYFQLNPNVKILLYAPTFRNNHQNCYDIDFESLYRLLCKKFEEEIKIIVRMHPNISSLDYGFKFNDYILNGTEYPDMYELLSECDMMINDYSSSMFEFSFLKKPIWLYATDIKEYKQNRGFYFDLEELPFPIAKNNEELLKNIEEYDYTKYVDKLNVFLGRLGIKEKGIASKIVVAKILKKI